MRKFSKLALLLSLMLSASFCISACNSDSSDSLGDSSSSSSYDPDEGKTPEDLEKEANNNYKERIAVWTRYVEYTVPEEKKALEDSQLTNKDTANVKTTVSANNQANTNLYQVTRTEDIYKNVEIAPEVVDDGGEVISPAQFDNMKTETQTTYSIYDAEADTLVLELSSLEYYALNDQLLDRTKKKSDEVEYQILAMGIEGLIIVQKTTYQLRKAEEPEEGEEAEIVDPALVSNYEEVITWSIYDKHGKVLHQDLPIDEVEFEQREVSEMDEWKTQKLVSIADKTYLIHDGEIIRTFERGTQYDVPEYLSANQSAYFQYGNYGYYVVEGQPEVMQIGDFYMARVPSVSFEIINADKELVWKYDTKSYHVAGYSVLSDGDIYLCEYKMLDATATDYDIENQGMKFEVLHSRIDVETGEVTKLEKEFVVSKIYNNVTPEMDTLLNNATTAEVLGNCTVKDGYMLAQIQIYTDGVLDSNSLVVVLDEEMNVVATLPKILENQFGYVGFLDSDTMLVNTITTDNKSIYYMANTATGDVELYFNANTQQGIQYIKGGFIYRNKIYDYDWNVVYDMTNDYEEYRTYSYEVKGNTVYIMETKEVTALEGTEYQTTVMVGYFTGGSYGTLNFTTKTMTTYAGRSWDSNIVQYDDCYKVTREDMYANKVEIYDHLGFMIVEIDTYKSYEQDEYWMEVQDSEGDYNNLGYNVTTSVSISEIGETGTYLVMVAETWQLDTYDYYPDAEHNKSGTYYQYYILK